MSIISKLNILITVFKDFNEGSVNCPQEVITVENNELTLYCSLGPYQKLDQIGSIATLEFQIEDSPYSIFSSVCRQEQPKQLYFRHEFNSASRLDAEETKVQILAVMHNGLCTLRGTTRTRLLHLHARP